MMQPHKVFLVCYLLTVLIQCAHSSLISNRSRSVGKFGFRNELEREHRNISSLRMNFNKSKWPKCTEEHFRKYDPCGFGIKDKFNRMITGNGLPFCFFLSLAKADFSGHLRRCKYLGKETTPWCPKHPDEWYFLTDTLKPGKSYWFDLNDKRKEGHFECTTGKKMAETFWMPGNPDNSHNEDCVSIHGKKGKWNDMSCEIKTHFLCQYNYAKVYTEKPVAEDPADIDVGENLVITCRLKNRDETKAGLHLVQLSASTSIKIEIGMVAEKVHKKDMASGPILYKTERSYNYYTDDLPVCLRDLRYSYHFTDVPYRVAHLKWKCCAVNGCTDEFSINVKVYPRKPELSVAWPSNTTGELYSGELLIAKCTAYIGGYSPVSIQWELKTKTRTYTWASNIEADYKHPEKGVEIINMPFTEKCPRTTDLYNPANGACYEISDWKTTFEKAFNLCQDRTGNDTSVPWHLLVMKPDKSLFHFIANQLQRGSKYWIGLNDRNVEGVFRWSDGLTTSKEEWGPYWIEHATEEEKWTKWDCAFMDKAGIHVHQPCESINLAFICSSPEQFTPSSLDLPTGAIDGARHTSTIKIKHRRSFVNSTLTCHSHIASHKGVKSYIATSRTRLNERSPKIAFEWGVRKPIIHVRKEANAGGKLLIATCETHLGDGDVMTWKFKPLRRKAQTWLIKTDGTIIYDEYPGVSVNILSVQKSDDLGNEIISTLEFNVTEKFEGSSMKCLPYNYTHGLLKHLKTHDKDIVRVYTLSLPVKKEPSSFRARNAGAFMLILILAPIAGVMFILLMSRERPSGAAPISEVQGEERCITKHE